PDRPPPTEPPPHRGGGPRALEGARHLPAVGGGSAGRRGRFERVRLLRRAAVRQRPPPLRPPRHRLREGRRPAVLDDAGPPRGTALRLGLPRTPRRDGVREGARDPGPAADP